MTIGAIAAYNYIKITKMREEVIQEVHTAYVAAAQSGSDDEIEDEEDEEDEEWERMDGDMNVGSGIADADGDVTPMRSDEQGGGQKGREEATP